MAVGMEAGRRLRIHTGSVRRLTKELAQYTSEQEAVQGRIDRLKQANADPYDLKHEVQLLEEARQMVPDTRVRLENALAELLRVEEDDSAKCTDLPELGLAQEAIAGAQKLLLVAP